MKTFLIVFPVTLLSLGLLVTKITPWAGRPTKQAIDVKLEMLGAVMVRAVLTNNGNKNIEVLKIGGILDTSPVKKAIVRLEGQERELHFDGIQVTMTPEALDGSNFQRIPAGESVTVAFNLAEVYDLTRGGTYTIQSSGILSFAEEGSTEIVGFASYASNKIVVQIDGKMAHASRLAFRRKVKRVFTNTDCQGAQRSAVDTAVKNTVMIAMAARQAAQSGSATRMNKYFKRADQDSRGIVAGVFDRMVKAYGNSTGSAPELHCADAFKACRKNVGAYTLGEKIVFCPPWFQGQTLVKKCETTDQASTSVHEATHVRFIKGTSDYGGYGLKFIRSLPSEKNLNHADTYTYFAHDAWVGC